LPRRSKSVLAKAHRLRGAVRPVILTFNDPEVGRLQWLGQLPAGAMVSEREAMIGLDLFEASSDETTKDFHARMVRTAREWGVFWVSIGYEPAREAAPYPPISGDGAGTRH
jgi:hypothetical protein